MQLIVNYNEPTFKVENGIYNGEYPKSLFFVSRGQFSLSVSELTGQPKLTAFQLMAVEGNRFAGSSIVVDGIEYAVDYTDEDTIVATVEAMYLVLSNAFNGVTAFPPNQFKYATGTAPSLQDFATALGATLVFPVISQDTVYFYNKNYTIPQDAFADSTLEEVVTMTTEIEGRGFDGNTSLISITASELKAIASDFVFKNCTSATSFVFGPNLTQLGSTTGDNGTFAGITGNTIAVTIPILFQTIDGGSMAGDLVYLDINNTVTFNWI